MSRLKTSLPESLATKVKTTIADWRIGRQDAAFVAARWDALDRKRRSELAGMARYCGRADRPAGSTRRRLPKKCSSAGFQHVLLLGMGGSSLCPEVLRMTFGRILTSLPCMCSIPPIPPRSKRSSIRSIFQKRCLLFPANPGARSSRTSSSNISSSARSRRLE